MPWDHKQSLKEVIKHMLFKSRAYRLVSAYRRRRGYITEHLDRERPVEIFREIYKLGVWVHVDGQASKSGRGSESTVTGQLSHELPRMLHDLDCKSLLDVGCGDWNWMSKMELPPSYVGIDIVPEVIETNKRYEREGVRFMVANATEDQLPSADAVLCREVLFHLSFVDGMAVLANIKRSGKWLIATTDNSIWFNSDIPTGDFRNINLQRSPYNFPPPDRVIPDNALAPQRVLGVWKTSDLPDFTH